MRGKRSVFGWLTSVPCAINCQKAWTRASGSEMLVSKTIAVVLSPGIRGVVLLYGSWKCVVAATLRRRQLFGSIPGIDPYKVCFLRFDYLSVYPDITHGF